MASLERNRPTGPVHPPSREPRLLFLDDDPVRAEMFLEWNPAAVWVQTVADCLARLEESWDEVHLDHDLGGEQYVELDRVDCGMEVVRWLCFEPRPHLQATRFYIHSHNSGAAMIMATQMEVAGFQVEFRPFGALRPSRSASSNARRRSASSRGWLGWLRALLGTAPRRAPGPMVDAD